MSLLIQDLIYLHFQALQENQLHPFKSLKTVTSWANDVNNKDKLDSYVNSLDVRVPIVQMRKVTAQVCDIPILNVKQFVVGSNQIERWHFSLIKKINIQANLDELRLWLLEL